MLSVFGWIVRTTSTEVRENGSIAGNAMHGIERSRRSTPCQRDARVLFSPDGTEELYANRHWSCMSGTGFKCVFAPVFVAFQWFAPTGASPEEIMGGTVSPTVRFSRGIRAASQVVSSDDRHSAIRSTTQKVERNSESPPGRASVRVPLRVDNGNMAACRPQIPPAMSPTNFVR
jgi:hypothetical protein